MKKFLIPIIIVTIVGIMAGALFFFRNSSAGEGGRTIGSFFPFGNNEGAASNTLFPPIINESGDTNDEAPTNVDSIILLRQIHNKSVSGFVALGGGSREPYVRFMERSVGHIFESGMSGVEKNRISNETLPAIYNTLWDSNGEGLAFMQLNNGNITTFATKINNNTGTSTETLFNSGLYLPEQIVTATSFGSKIFYIYPTSNGSIGTVASFNGNNKNQIFSSSLTEWLSSWVNKDTIVLTTKPSSEVLGYMYVLDITKKKTTKMLGGVKGLTTLMSPDKKLIVYTEAYFGGIGTLLYNTDTSEVFPLALNTLPEKCVWSTKNSSTLYCSSPNTIPGGKYPDDWYKGVVSFSDSIWKVDTSTNTAELLSVLSVDAGEEIDAIKPTLSPNEDYLVFVNKKDSTLWSLRLVAPTPPKEVILPEDINIEPSSGL